MLIPYSNAKIYFQAQAFSPAGLMCSMKPMYYFEIKYECPALEKKFPAMMKQQLGEDYKEGGFVLHLQPITDIHLE